MSAKLSCSRLEDRSAVAVPLFPDRESLIFAFACCIFKAGAKFFKSSEMTKNNLIVFIYLCDDSP